MKVKITHKCAVDGKHCEPGDEPDVDHRTASLLFGMGYATRADGTEPARESAALDTSTAEAATLPKAKGRKPKTN